MWNFGLEKNFSSCFRCENPVILRGKTRISVSFWLNFNMFDLQARKIRTET